MRLTNWGNYPKASGKCESAHSDDEVRGVLLKNQPLIVQGNHRSYGDSAFCKQVLNLKSRDYLLQFDTDKGILHCQAGVLFSDLLAVIVPKGWLLPVLPGTQFISVGGAIASDVHGKNHHHTGTFCQFVISFSLMLADGTIINCSKRKNIKYFHATCGGMGLTGVILDAKIQLVAIQSNSITQTTIKCKNLSQIFSVFEKNANSLYTVAWLDSMTEGKSLGKGIVMLGEPQTSGALTYDFKTKIKLPFYLPAFIMNRWTAKIFNYLYYAKSKENTQIISLQKFFFPLDNISGWNKLYGRNGFLQFQCVLPMETSHQGIAALLKQIGKSNQASFLAVLKPMGKANNNLLSFPMAGYSLALDFKYNNTVLSLLDELDKIVIKYQGRIYLCKDARMSKNTFDQGYKNADEFRKFRRQMGLDKQFSSLQSKRLGL
jgi:FAD/FMN-containing dehydrogenase